MGSGMMMWVLGKVSGVGWDLLLCPSRHYVRCIDDLSSVQSTGSHLLFSTGPFRPQRCHRNAEKERELSLTSSSSRSSGYPHFLVKAPSPLLSFETGSH